MGKVILALFCAAALQAQQPAGSPAWYSAAQYAYGFSPALSALSVSLPNPATGSQSMSVSYGILPAPGVHNWAPLATNAPIVVGQGAGAETVTPSAINCKTPGVYGSCSFVATFTLVHGKGESISSATYGLQEALNVAASAGGGIVWVDNSWYALGGTTGMISAAITTGTTAVQDISKGLLTATGGSATSIKYTPSGTGNVPRSLQAKWAEQPVSIKDFPVVADGVTDDSAAIIEAYNASVASNRSLYIPRGIYAMASPLVIASTNDVRIYGDGPNLSQLVAINNNDLIDISGTSARVNISGLWFGTLANQSAGYALNVTGVSAGSVASAVNVSNITIQNMPFGIYSRYASQCLYNGLTFKQSRAAASVGDPIYIEDTSSTSLSNILAVVPVGTYAGHTIELDSNDDTINIRAADLQGSAGATVYLHNSLGGANTGPRLVRLNDVFAETGLKGFQIDDCRDARLQGVHAVNNTEEGVLVTGGTSISIINSLAAQNKHDGFKISGGNGVSIIGSTASNNSSTNTNTYGGILLASANGARLIGNNSQDFIFSPPSQGYGISITTPTDFAYVETNKLTANTAPFLNTSTGTHNWILQPENTAGIVSGGPVQLTGVTQPTCAAGINGQIWYSGHAAGVKDSVAVCAADAANAYAWRTIY